MAYKAETMELSGEIFKSHEQENRETDVFICEYCQNEFVFSTALKLHMAAHTSTKNHHYNFCEYSTNQTRDLVVHIRSHLNERPFKCQEPNREASFASLGDLKKHQQTHNNNDQRFSCSICPYKTHTKKNFTAHVKNMHTESTKSFKCPHKNCEYSVKQKSRLTKHLKMHSEEKNQVCPHPNCGFKTKWSSNLKRHLEIHSKGENDSNNKNSTKEF